MTTQQKFIAVEQQIIAAIESHSTDTVVSIEPNEKYEPNDHRRALILIAKGQYVEIGAAFEIDGVRVRDVNARVEGNYVVLHARLDIVR